MMRQVRWLDILIASIAVCLSLPCTRGVAEEEAPGYEFTVDGKPFAPPVFSLEGAPGGPRPGDVVLVEGLALTLGPEKVCRFITTPETDGRLLLRMEDGTRRVVGAAVDWSFQDGREVLFDPFARLKPEEIRQLWGVRLDGWPDGIESKLQHIDPVRTCVTVTDRAARGNAKSFPPLPEDIRYLRVDENSDRGIANYRPLRRFTALRWLALRAMTSSYVDLAWIAGNTQLQYLDVSGNNLRNLSAAKALKNLRVLDLGWCESASDLAFAASMSRLRRIELSRTEVADLSPLSDLLLLEEINAAMTPVVRLPCGELPALRRLTVFSTEVSDEAVAAFAEAHPRCIVSHRWDESFRQAAAATTRIRARSGGTCHRLLDLEKTLFEVTQPEKIREVLRRLEIDETQSGFHCMCCGEPSFEFYRGEELIATLGFHHGRSLRWPDGWPGDGMLTGESADFFVQWLADHGVRGPLEEREHTKKQEAATRRRFERYEAILPPEVLDGLNLAESAEDAKEAFVDGIEDETERIVVYLRMLGCDSASWNLYCGLDDFFVESVLPEVGKPALSAAVRKGVSDPAAANGAARWIFEERKVDSIDSETLKAVLPDLGRTGLGHPREANRRKTLAALGRINSPEAIELLRACLAGNIAVEPLPEEEEVEPGGKVVFRPEDRELKETWSDAACAAWILSKLSHRASLPLMQTLRERSTGDDRKALDEAVERLAKQPAADEDR